jgi:hypothetical protein
MGPCTPGALSGRGYHTFADRDDGYRGPTTVGGCPAPQITLKEDVREWVCLTVLVQGL